MVEGCRLEHHLLKAKGSQNMQVQISVRLARLEQMEHRAGKNRLGLGNCLCKAQQNKKAVELKEELELLDPAQTPVLGAACSDGLTSGV